MKTSRIFSFLFLFLAATEVLSRKGNTNKRSKKGKGQKSVSPPLCIDDIAYGTAPLAQIGPDNFTEGNTFIARFTFPYSNLGVTPVLGIITCTIVETGPFVPAYGLFSTVRTMCDLQWNFEDGSVIHAKISEMIYFTDPAYPSGYTEQAVSFIGGTGSFVGVHGFATSGICNFDVPGCDYRGFLCRTEEGMKLLGN